MPPLLAQFLQLLEAPSPLTQRKKSAILPDAKLSTISRHETEPSLSNQKLQYLVVLGSAVKPGCSPSPMTTAAVSKSVKSLAAILLSVLYHAKTMLRMAVPQCSPDTLYVAMSTSFHKLSVWPGWPPSVRLLAFLRWQLGRCPCAGADLG